MKHGSSLGRWYSPRVVALAAVLAMVPLPVMAGPPPGAPAVPAPIQASVAAIVASQPLAATPHAAAQTAPTDTGSVSFFKKPIGVAVLAVFAAGVGYAVYSTSHDRVKSPAKQ